MAVSIQIKNTLNYGRSAGVKILVYGKAGRGKTMLCATCPNPIIFSAESGLLTLSHLQLPYVEIRNIGDLRDGLTWARTSNEARQFQTLCLDSISDIAETLLSSLKAGKKDGRQAYGELNEDMMKTFREWRDIPGFNVYMTAKQERVKDDLTGQILNGPMMPGNKLGQNVPYFPDEVFKLDIQDNGQGQTYRYLQTQPDFANDAKDRSGRLNPVEEPHLGKIINKINGHQ